MPLPRYALDIPRRVESSGDGREPGWGGTTLARALVGPRLAKELIGATGRAVEQRLTAGASGLAAICPMVGALTMIAESCGFRAQAHEIRRIRRS